MNILLVEDDGRITSGLEYTLTQEGYTVTCSENVAHAINAIAAQEFQLGMCCKTRLCKQPLK